MRGDGLAGAGPPAARPRLTGSGVAGRSGRPRVRWVGELALEVVVGPDRPDLRTVGRAQGVGAALLAADLPGVVDVVPGLRTVLVTLDRTRSLDDPQRMRAQVRRVAERAAAGPPGRGAPPGQEDPRTLTIHVRYGGEDGPDLAQVADETGLSPEAVVARHAGRAYTVLALGFRPGFAFLGFVEPALAVPRLATPRLRVPRGSVGLAGRQTGVYPTDAPGGWRLIGRTGAALFDPGAATLAQACLLRPGDRVQFEADPAGAVP